MVLIIVAGLDLPASFQLTPQPKLLLRQRRVQDGRRRWRCAGARRRRPAAWCAATARTDAARKKRVLARAAQWSRIQGLRPRIWVVQQSPGRVLERQRLRPVGWVLLIGNRNDLSVVGAGPRPASDGPGRKRAPGNVPSPYRPPATQRGIPRHPQHDRVHAIRQLVQPRPPPSIPGHSGFVSYMNNVLTAARCMLRLHPHAALAPPSAGAYVKAPRMGTRRRAARG